MPPDVLPIKEEMDRKYDEMERDAEMARQFRAGGWALIRASELAELRAQLAALREQMQADVRGATPPNGEWASIADSAMTSAKNNDCQRAENTLAVGEGNL